MVTANGFRGATIMASLINALVLLFVTGGIVCESLRRLATPQPVGGKTVIVVALIGVAINSVSALLFARGRKHDLNVRSAFLRLASDADLYRKASARGIDQNPTRLLAELGVTRTAAGISFQADEAARVQQRAPEYSQRG